jgi:protein involved in polysaccharide export with SLBB domain
MRKNLLPIRSLTLALVALAVALAGAVLPAAVHAQQTPSASQIEAYKNLPPDQQRAIFEQMMKGSRGATQAEKLEFPATTRPKTGQEALDAEEEDLLRERIPRLRGGDTVVLDVAIREPDDDEFPEEPWKVRRQQEIAEKQVVVGSGGQADEKGRRQTEEERAREARRKKATERTEQEEEALNELRQRLLDRNPYKLDPMGGLSLPGVGTISLAGLTEEQATKRLVTDPALRDLRLILTLLPLARQDVEALKPFGYDLFSALPTTFAPATDVPVPSEYVIGPGDVLQLQILGATKGEYALTVGRNGEVRLPEIGPVAVAGLRYAEARELIESRVAERMIGARAVVSMGELRSITIFVTGEAESPGAYTVSSLSTITNALFATGGVKPIGSLRNIQLKRRGNIVATLDLYDLLLRGDSRDDLRLQSNDVIFIPPVGSTAGVSGAIRRPAIYELKGEATTADLLYLAGGLTPEADPRMATLERIDEARERQMLDVDLTSPAGRSTRLRSGDLLRLRAVSPSFTNGVSVAGHVYRPMSVGWRQGLRLADVLRSPQDLKPDADLNYVLIRRESTDRKVSAISASLLEAWRQPSSAENVLLAPRDQILVFSLEGGRELVLKPILEDLRRQAQAGEPTKIVGVGGRVKAEGQYPLEPGMTVADLVRAGGGLDEAAYGVEAELTRHEIVNGEQRRSALVKIDLARALAGDTAADFVLQPFDFLVIKELPQWSEQATVEIGGEVRFPGTYPIKRGETLTSLIERAGGFTDLAFPEGAVFTRVSLKEREAKQIESLANRLQGDLASLALQATQVSGRTGEASASEAVAVGKSLLESLRETQPVGRLVIDLQRVLAGGPGAPTDVMLKDGDRLLVPDRMQEVTVLGEVQSTTSHLWDPALQRDDYVGLSGGLTQKADERRIYVVRANGSVVAGSSSRWFRGGGEQIRPGDTIVVPLDAERMRPLTLWTAVSTIVYNLAIAVAAVNSFN